MSISAIVLSFSGVGVGRRVDQGEFQAVAQTGGAQPSPAQQGISPSPLEEVAN